MIENIALYKTYLDVYSYKTITISSTVNQSGTLSVDGNGNSLLSTINAGRLVIDKCTTKTITGGVILYNSVNFVYFDNTFTNTDTSKQFTYNPSLETKYYLYANVEVPTSVIGDKLNLNLTNKNVFLVYINGRKITSSNFTHDDTGVTITGFATNYITGINDYIKIYTYADTQTITAGQSVVLQYEAPTTFNPTLTSLNDGSFFSGMTDISNFDDFTTNDNNTFLDENRLFEYVYVKKDITNSKQMTFTSLDEFYTTVKDKLFRVIFWDSINSKLMLYVKCAVNNNVDVTLNLTNKQVSYTISFENEIIKTTWV